MLVFCDDFACGRLLTFSDIVSLQQTESGTFAGDQWGETDTRFLYGAMLALSLLNLLHLADVDKAVQHVLSCANFDGGFGSEPGAESHSGQILTCVGALAIAGRLDLIDIDKLGGWLSERQLPNGGLNGRPEKKEDVCYSWWVASSLAMIGRLYWIDGSKLAEFILKAQVGWQCIMLLNVLTNDSQGSRARWHFRPSWRYGRRLSHALWYCWLESAQVSWTGRD